jgi:Flagellar motor switch/type III secretory pathway protein
MPASANSARQGDATQTAIDSLPVAVEAVLGAAKMSVGELTKLGVGDSFILDSKLGDAVDLRVNGVVVACGEIVAIGDYFGVRIQSVARE